MSRYILFYAFLIVHSLFDMSLDGLKALGADYMLHAAGVRYGYIRGYTQADQPGGDKLVPFIDTVRYFAARFCQCNVAFRGYLDVPAFPQFFHGNADAGLFEIQFRCNIYGTYYREALA